MDQQKKQFVKGKPSGEKKSFGEKRSFDKKPYDQKPYGVRKSYGEKKPYGEKKDFGDKKPFERKFDGEKKPFEKKFDGEKRSFEKKSFELEINELSEPVKTEYGYHVILRIPGYAELVAKAEAEAETVTNNAFENYVININILDYLA